MPGFNVTGNHANQKLYTAEPRRRHRWLVTFLGPVFQPGDLVYLQKASRPNFKYESPEMHHDQEVSYFAGKQSWETMSWTFYDMEQPVDVSQRLYQWVTTITTNFQTPAAITSVTTPGEYKTNAKLQMQDGRGNPSEQWTLYGAWPMETNWNDLDYGDSEIALVEVTVRYDKAVPNKVA